MAHEAPRDRLRRACVGVLFFFCNRKQFGSLSTRRPLRDRRTSQVCQVVGGVFTSSVSVCVCVSGDPETGGVCFRPDPNGGHREKGF